MNKILGILKNSTRQLKLMPWILSCAKPHLPRILLLLIMDVSGSFLGIGMALISKEIIDSAGMGRIIMQPVVFYGMLSVVMIFLATVTGMLSLMVFERFAFRLRKEIYNKIMRSYWREVSEYHSGDLMTRLTTDTGNVADGIVNVIPGILKLLIELGVTFLVLFRYEPALAVFALLLSPAAGLAAGILGRSMKRIQHRVQQSESEYRSFLQESISNQMVIKSFSKEDYAAENLEKLKDERLHWVYRRGKVQLTGSAMISLAFNFGYIGAFAFGALQLSKQAITYGMMTVFLTLVNRIQAPMIALAQYIPKMVSILTSAERLTQLQQMKEEEKKGGEIKTSQIGMEVSGLTFGYTEKNIFEDLSFSVRPGEFVAVMGESGIGKTSLIRLILSFMNQAGGEIYFHNLTGEREKAGAGTRELTAYVPQGNTLFSGTIRDNIRIGRPEAGDEDIKEALRIASGLDFVLGLSQGLDTVVGENGYGLSEGQAQRIAIARALIRKAPFLILDEATSALDEQTELKVLEGIRQFVPNLTGLLITHRRSALKYCDREIKIPRVSD